MVDNDANRFGRASDPSVQPAAVAFRNSRLATFASTPLDSQAMHPEEKQAVASNTDPPSDGAPPCSSSSPVTIPSATTPPATAITPPTSTPTSPFALSVSSSIISSSSCPTSAAFFPSSSSTLSSSSAHNSAALEKSEIILRRTSKGWETCTMRLLGNNLAFTTVSPSSASIPPLLLVERTYVEVIWAYDDKIGQKFQFYIVDAITHQRQPQSYQFPQVHQKHHVQVSSLASLESWLSIFQTHGCTIRRPIKIGMIKIAKAKTQGFGVLYPDIFYYFKRMRDTTPTHTIIIGEGSVLEELDNNQNFSLIGSGEHTNVLNFTGKDWYEVLNDAIIKKKGKKHPDSLHEGSLMKSGKKMGWKRRYCVLMQDHILCYKSYFHAKPKSTISLPPGADVEELHVADARNKYQFWVSANGDASGTRRYRLATPSEQEKREWLNVLFQLFTTKENRVNLESIKEGYLYKKSSRGVWDKKYVVLLRSAIFYASNRNDFLNLDWINFKTFSFDTNKIGYINLYNKPELFFSSFSHEDTNITITEQKDEGGVKTIVFRALSHFSQQEWIIEIQYLLKQHEERLDVKSLREGFLRFKKRKTWERGYFVLLSDSLLYYRNRSDNDISRAVCITATTDLLQLVGDTNQPFQFSLLQNVDEADGSGSNGGSGGCIVGSSGGSSSSGGNNKRGSCYGSTERTPSCTGIDIACGSSSSSGIGSRRSSMSAHSYSLTFSCETAEQRKAWMDTLAACIKVKNMKVYPESVLEGYMWKKKKTGDSLGKKLYFILRDDNVLHYFRNREDVLKQPAQPYKKFELRSECELLIIDNDNHNTNSFPYMLSLAQTGNEGEKILKLSSFDEATRQEWFDAMKKQIQRFPLIPKSNTSLKEGYCYIRQEGVWKKRFYILEDDSLSFYCKKLDTAPDLIFFLQEDTNVALLDSNTPRGLWGYLDTYDLLPPPHFVSWRELDIQRQIREQGSFSFEPFKKGGFVGFRAERIEQEKKYATTDRSLQMVICNNTDENKYNYRLKNVDEELCTKISEIVIKKEFALFNRDCDVIKSGDLFLIHAFLKLDVWRTHFVVLTKQKLIVESVRGGVISCVVVFSKHTQIYTDPNGCIYISDGKEKPNNNPGSSNIVLTIKTQYEEEQTSWTTAIYACLASLFTSSSPSHAPSTPGALQTELFGSDLKASILHSGYFRLPWVVTACIEFLRNRSPRGLSVFSTLSTNASASSSSSATTSRASHSSDSRSSRCSCSGSSSSSPSSYTYSSPPLSKVCLLQHPGFLPHVRALIQDFERTGERKGRGVPAAEKGQQQQDITSFLSHAESVGACLKLYLKMLQDSIISDTIARNLVAVVSESENAVLTNVQEIISMMQNENLNTLNLIIYYLKGEIDIGAVTVDEVIVTWCPLLMKTMHKDEGLPHPVAIAVLRVLLQNVAFLFPVPIVPIQKLSLSEFYAIKNEYLAMRFEAFRKSHFGMELFLQWTKENLSSENISFLNAVQQYRYMCQKTPSVYTFHDCFEAGMLICNTYVRVGAEQQVNISADLSEAILSVFREVHKKCSKAGHSKNNSLDNESNNNGITKNPKYNVNNINSKKSNPNGSSSSNANTPKRTSVRENNAVLAANNSRGKGNTDPESGGGSNTSSQSHDSLLTGEEFSKVEAEVHVLIVTNDFVRFQKSEFFEEWITFCHLLKTTPSASRYTSFSGSAGASTAASSSFSFSSCSSKGSLLDQAQAFEREGNLGQEFLSLPRSGLLGSRLKNCNTMNQPHIKNGPSLSPSTSSNFLATHSEMNTHGVDASPFIYSRTLTSNRFESKNSSLDSQSLVSVDNTNDAAVPSIEPEDADMLSEPSSIAIAPDRVNTKSTFTSSTHKHRFRRPW